MPALTQGRDTASRSGDNEVHPVLANMVIFAGALVMADAAGWAKPGVTATGLVPLGRAEKDIDNSTGLNGDKTIEVFRSIFNYENDGSITRANIGATVYVVDDQTFAATDGTGTRSSGGRLIQVDGDGSVWVDVR